MEDCTKPYAKLNPVPYSTWYHLRAVDHRLVQYSNMPVKDILPPHKSRSHQRREHTFVLFLHTPAVFLTDSRTIDVQRMARLDFGGVYS
jgi:hypothetical protein